MAVHWKQLLWIAFTGESINTQQMLNFVNTAEAACIRNVVQVIVRSSDMGNANQAMCTATGVVYNNF